MNGIDTDFLEDCNELKESVFCGLLNVGGCFEVLRIIGKRGFSYLGEILEEVINSLFSDECVIERAGLEVIDEFI